MTVFSEHESLFAWLEWGICCFGLICTSYDPILSGSFPKWASKPSVYLPPFEKNPPHRSRQLAKEQCRCELVFQLQQGGHVACVYTCPLVSD